MYRNLYTLIFILLSTGAFAYSLLVYGRGTAHPVSENIPSSAAAGKMVYQKYNCQACHQIYGLGGYMGPDLTNVISSPGKGELYAKALITTGTARMPNLNLSENEISQLAEYLKLVDKTGQFPIFKPEINMWGDVNVPEKNLNTAQN